MSGSNVERRGLAAAVALGLLAVGVVTVDGSRAAFSATTANGTNRVRTGTVDVSAEHDATVLFRMDRMVPGATEARCTRIRYTGSSPVDVRLHARASGELAPWIDVAVEVGPDTAGGEGDAGCDGFEPRAVVFRGSLHELAGRHASFGSGLGGFTRARRGESRRYRVTAALRDDPLAPAPQGTAATADLTWEAAP